MRKNQYLYLGDKTGSRMFYAVNEEKFYRSEGAGSGLQISVTAFIGIIFYVLVRNLNAAELNYNGTVYVICSAIVGLLLSIAFQQYGIKANEKYFSNIGPAEVPYGEQMAKMLRQAMGITRIYSIGRIFIVILILVIPFLVEEQKNIVMFFSYFILWFVFGILFFHFNLRQRRKILKKMREEYL